MNDRAPENYELEPTEAAAQRDEAIPKPRQVGIPRPADVEPLPVESDDVDPAKRSVKELDVCPNCGGSMRGGDQLVCIRCGFDLKTMKPVETKIGETTAPAEEFVDADRRTPLIQPGSGDFWLPAALAGVSGLILLAGFLAGLPGLFPYITTTTNEQGQILAISFFDRISGLARTTVLAGMQVACGMGALVFLAAVLGLKTAATIEHLKLGAIRMLAIVLTMRLATLLALASPTLEWLLESVLQLAAFMGLSLALFRLKPRDAATLTGAALILFVLLWLAAYAVIWAAKV